MAFPLPMKGNAINTIYDYRLLHKHRKLSIQSEIAAGYPDEICSK